MRIKSLILTILIACVLISCKKEAEENPKEDLKQTDSEIIVSEATVAEEENDTLVKVKAVLSQLGQLKKEVSQKLVNASPKESNRLYEEYRSKCIKWIAYLERLEGKLVSNYATYYNLEQEEKVFPQYLQPRINAINKSDLEFWELGEGYTELRLKPNHLYSIFKGKVTPDYDYFLKISAQQDGVLDAADAGLLISMEDLGDRVLAWEKFRNAYPKSPLFKDATERYQSYGYMYLMGLDNTSTFDFPEGTLYPVALEEYERYINKNPKSHFTQIIKTFIAKFDQKTSFEDVQKFVNSALGRNPQKGE